MGGAACESSTEVGRTKGDTTSGSGGAGGVTVSSSAASVGGAGGGGGPSASSAESSSSSSSSGTGGNDPWAGPIESLKELDLGDVTLGVLRTIPIPDHTLGFTLLATAPTKGDVIGIGALRSPSNGYVIQNYAMTGHTSAVFGNEGWVAAANPQSDAFNAVPVAAGNWRVALGDDDQSIDKAHVSVWVRRTNDGQFHGGVVDVNVFIAPGVVGQNYINQVLSGIFAGGYAGLTLGSVKFAALPASATVVETRDELRQIAESVTAGVTAPAINLFVVDNLGNAEFGDAIGVAGGIPGSPMKPATALSGVVYTPSGDPNYDASVLRHEVGHQSGLFHTTEFQIQETDPISDTPSCANNVITSNPNSCPDVGNMMFPIAYGATTMTPAQVRVIQGSALYRGALEDGASPAPPLPLPPSPAPGPNPNGADPFAAAPVGVRSLRSLPASPDAIERVLGAVWCTHAGDYEALVLRAASRDSRDSRDPAGAAARLRASVLDGALPDFMRARALSVYVRAAQASAASLDLAASIALREGEPTALRTAALRALSRFDVVRARKAASGVARSLDPIVADVG